MAINVIQQVSPGIVVNEVDLTQRNVTPGKTTIGAFVGEFQWGPISEPVFVESTGDLYTKFRAPRDQREISHEGSSFFTCFNYLGYGGGGMFVVRSSGVNSRNAFPSSERYDDLKVGNVTTAPILFDANTGEQIVYFANSSYISNVTAGMVMFKEPTLNKLLHTESFENPYWTKSNMSIGTNTQEVTDPFGGHDAEKLIPTTANRQHFIERNTTLSSPYFTNEGYTKANNGTILTTPLKANDFITLSVYAKAPTLGYSNVALEIINQQNTGSRMRGIFSLAGSGTVANTFISGTAKSYANSATISYNSSTGWYRCAIYCRPSDIEKNIPMFRVYSTGDSVANTLPSFSGDNVRSTYLFGIQAEQGKKATKYIRNDSAIVTQDTLISNVLDVFQDGANVSFLLESQIDDNEEIFQDQLFSFKTANTVSDLKIDNLESFTHLRKVKDLSTYGPFVARYPGVLGNSLKVTVCSSNEQFSNWKDPITGFDYAELFNEAPGTSNYVINLNEDDDDLTSNTSYGWNDEIHVVVVDSKGFFTGTAGTILEKFSALSKATDVFAPNGGNNYYIDVINNKSNYIFATGFVDPKTTSLTWGKKITEVGSFAKTNNFYGSFAGGVYDNPNVSQIVSDWDLFKLKENYSFDVVLSGDYSNPIGSESGNTVILSVLDNIVHYRKDCVMFISPMSDSIINQTGSEANNIVDFFANKDFGLNINSSYAVADNNWKYQYDKWNKIYRWVPMNADTAGLCARTDQTNDPWFSPAGYNRGKIMNVVKLAWNANESERGILYKKGINSIIYQTGEGTLLLGDKTLQKKESAFDRINVRRLFLTLEKTISAAAKLQLFEFNDEFTRSRFVSIVEPYLRQVQGRRGIEEFKVVCDTSNNTPEVIDSNGFIADIYIKPARSINFIQLNFIATASGVDFNTITL